MADKVISFPVSCKGGLDETSTIRELQSKPGFATVLYNFEVSQDGGYRRVNGYQKLGTLGKTPDVTETPILGMHIHSGGYVICKGSNVYFTYGDDLYVTLNKTGATTGKTKVQMDALTTEPRSSTARYNFESFSKGTETTLVGVSKGDNPMHITIEGSSFLDNLFQYKELTLTQGSLTGAQYLEKYKDQLVIAGMDQAPTEIYYSDILKPDDFEGANAGAIGFNDVVTGLKMFREILYVFCKNSIHKVSGLETGSPQRQQVTGQLGCVNGDSIQEVAGDLVFLGPDGLRTLSATERIADVNLSTLSQNIQGRLRRLIHDIDSFDISSTVIRNKAQYRMFLRPKIEGLSHSPSAFSMYMSNDGLVQFSELGGFDVTAIHSGYVGTEELVVSGSSKGDIYFHDQGNDQDGTEINFLYETPSFDMGDNTITKNILKVITRLKPEGVADFNMALVYDYQAAGHHSPPAYSMSPVDAPTVYGTGKYGSASYGVSRYSTLNTLTEGSGKVLAIRIFPSGLKCDPFALQGFDLQFIPSGNL